MTSSPGTHHPPLFHRNAPVKTYCRVATTANIAIATALNAGDSIDGVTLAAGDRVLVKDQTTGSQNGIFVVDASPYRAFDMDTSSEVVGTMVRVTEGTANGGKLFLCTNTDPVTLGTTTITFSALTPSSGGSGLPWFVVTDYGAVGNGTTDDTGAIDSAIAALNAAGSGVLYFPAPPVSYRCTAALTTITADFIVMGDGSEGDLLAVHGRPTLVTCESATAVLFSSTSRSGLYRDIVIRNTAATAPTAGAGILVDGADEWRRVSYDNIKVEGFYDNIDSQNGIEWFMRGCIVASARRYGLRVRSVHNADIGDWSISDSAFYTYAVGWPSSPFTTAAALRIESSGGGKVTNTKFIFPGNYAIDIVGGASTSVFLVANCSIESYTISGIRSVGAWPYQIYSGLEFGQYAAGGSYGTGHALDLSGNTDVILDNLTLVTDVSAKTAIALSSMTRCAVGQLTNNGFATLISGTPDQDGTGGVGGRVFITGTPTSGQVPVASSGTAAAWVTPAAVPAFATPAIILGTVAAAGAAATVIRSDGTIVAFDATAPTTEAFGDVAATGSAAVAARRDHLHGMPAAPATSSGTDHEHIGDIQFSGDGSTVAFELPAAPFDAYSVQAYVAGVRLDVVLSGTMLTTMTFGSAPAAGTNNIIVDLIAAAA